VKAGSGKLIALAIGILAVIILGTRMPFLFYWENRTVPKQPASKATLQEARYYRKLDNNRVQCQTCFRECIVEEGEKGFCRNRINKKGIYYTLVYALPCAVQIDPIEKEPAFHMLPGTRIFCLATASCNNRCLFCHNWHISQRGPEETTNYYMSPEEVVQKAIEYECPTISFTYTEPTVFYEYMYDISRLAKQKGIRILFHSNGSMNPEPLEDLLKYTDAVTIDLKSFDPEFYRKISSSERDPVLRTLKIIRQAKVHLEIVNLIIPTLNDNGEKIQEMCRWIKENLGADTPIHFNRFFPSHKLTNLPPTPVETLEAAREIALKQGLKFVYVGNVPGHKYNSTFCPHCGKVVLERVHFMVLNNYLVDGKCKFCGYRIRGIWK